MAVQDGEALALEGVPDINGVVVVSCEQEAPWQGERDRVISGTLQMDPVEIFVHCLDHYCGDIVYSKPLLLISHKHNREITIIVFIIYVFSERRLHL